MCNTVRYGCQWDLYMFKGIGGLELTSLWSYVSSAMWYLLYFAASHVSNYFCNPDPSPVKVREMPNFYHNQITLFCNITIILQRNLLIHMPNYPSTYPNPKLSVQIGRLKPWKNEISSLASGFRTLRPLFILDESISYQKYFTYPAYFYVSQGAYLKSA